VALLQKNDVQLKASCGFSPPCITQHKHLFHTISTPKCWVAEKKELRSHTKKGKDVKKEVRSHTKKEKDARLSQMKWKKVLVSHTKTQREIKY
jgi:hypothetical protein